VIEIDRHVAADADMRKLLDGMGAPAAEAYDADDGFVEALVAIGTKETLTGEPVHAALQVRSGAPTSVKCSTNP